MSKTSVTILVIVCLIIFCVITMFPGWFPIRPLEGVFVKVCDDVLRGEFAKFDEEVYVGSLGVPTRKDYVICGRDPAVDANEVCYIAPMEESIISDGNPMGSEMDDECYRCQYGWELVKHGKKTLGKVCKPYKSIWRWNYKSPF